MIGRREYLKLISQAAAKSAALICAATLTPHALSAQPPMAAPLWLSRNGESFFFDAYSAQGYATACYLLRDVRANVIGRPDPWVLRAMSQMQVWWAHMGHHVRMDITSGLRTRRTNERIEGAAQASRHLPGHNMTFDAVDLRPGHVDITVAARWARAAGISGLGLNTNRNFLHIDRGRVRQWGR